MKHWILGMALLASPSLAQSDSSQARNGDFGGILLITADPEGFWKAWEQPGTPNIQTTTTVTLSKPVYGMVVFHGCKAAADGNCNVAARFLITAPDGSNYADPKGGDAWKGAPAPGQNLLASASGIGFRLEPQDKLGRYKITAILTDNVAKKSITMFDYVTAEMEPKAN